MELSSVDTPQPPEVAIFEDDGMIQVLTLHLPSKASADIR